MPRSLGRHKRLERCFHFRDLPLGLDTLAPRQAVAQLHIDESDTLAQLILGVELAAIFNADVVGGNDLDGHGNLLD